MLKRSLVGSPLAGAAIMLVGCGGGTGQSQQQTATAAMEPNQSEICQTESIGIAANCQPGQKIVFLPEQFGNAQLPVYFAAANCDLRFSVVATNGAVTCIFMPIKPVEEARPATEPAGEAEGK